MKIENTRAVALKYDRNLPAPFVLAKGRGRLAEQVLGFARESGIPIQEDAELLDRLFVLETGEFIPEELYRMVAQLLVFVHTLTIQRK